MIEKLLSATESLWLRRLLVILSWPVAVFAFVFVVGLLSLPMVAWACFRDVLVEVLESAAGWLDGIVDALASWGKVSARHWKAREVE